ncbi:MAG: hypothetical protein HKN47_16860 [Pirellulaceae bacterium]|nr:hypothetical protein [Pirellulaceae bacterium]
MLKTDNPLLELTLQLQQQYQHLDRLLDSITDASSAAIESIGPHMNEIKRTEAALGPLREQFHRTSEQMTPALKNATDETIDLVKGLMPKLAQLEKTTFESAQRLFPKIQESVRAVQMQNAYSSSNRAS